MKSLQLDKWMNELDAGLLDDMKQEEMTMTEQQVQCIKAKVMRKIRLRKGKRFLVFVAAAAAALSVATAAAAGSFGGGELFGRYFGRETLQPGWLERMCSQPQATAEADGYRVDLLGIMGDSHSVNLILDLTAPDGEVLSDTARFESTQLLLDQKTGFSAGWSMVQLEDEDAADNKARFLFAVDTDQKIAGKTAILRLEMLQQSGETPQSETYEESVLSSAQWELTFPMDYETFAVKKSVNKKAAWKEQTIVIRNVELSPISLRVQLSGFLKGEKSFLIFSADGSLSGLGEEYEPVLRMKDGSMVSIEGISMSAGESHTFSGRLVTWNFDRLVDIGEAEALIFMGKESTVYKGLHRVGI